MMNEKSIDMKTAEEYSDDVVKLWSKFDWDEINFNQFKNYVKNYIEQAQRESYNQALEEGQYSPRIKQLEWVEVWEGYEDARTPFGHYVVRPSIDNKIFLMIDLRKGIQSYSTLNEAKAAAQADFEQRVNECLE